MTSQIFENFLNTSNLKILYDYYKDRSYVETERGIKNKFLEYHITSDISYELLHDSIEKILPGHAFDTGSYKESIAPYGLHVDSFDQHDKIGAMLGLDNRVDYTPYNAAVLIPLVEDKNFKTISFNIFSNRNVTDYEKHKLTVANILTLDDVLHDTKARFLPIDKVFTWRLGDAFVWPRNQLHMSNNFIRYNLTKKFLILFLK